MNGLPAKPISGTRPASARLISRDGVEHVAQLRHVGDVERADRRVVRCRAREARALAFGERQAETHRVGNGEDVGEQDRGVERIARERLQRDLGRERRRCASAMKLPARARVALYSGR